MKLKGSENSILHGLMEDININKDQVLFLLSYGKHLNDKTSKFIILWQG